MDIPSLLHRHWNRLRPISDRIVLHIDAPANDSILKSREAQMKRSFPKELRRFMATVSGELIFTYSLSDEFLKRAELPGSCSCGELKLGGFQPALCESMWSILMTNWSGWEDAFVNPDDYSSSCSPKFRELGLKFNEVFPVMETFCGNVLAITDTDNSSSRVIYLDHEGGDFDGTILAPSFAEFMQTWCELACPSIDDLSLFYCPNRKRLVTDTAAGIQWRKSLDIG